MIPTHLRDKEKSISTISIVHLKVQKVQKEE